MKLKSLLFLLLTLVWLHSTAQTIIGRQKVDQFPVSASGTLTYGLTWLPQTYDNTTTRRYPLIIFLHGTGEAGNTINSLNLLCNATPKGVPGRIADGWNAVAVNPKTGVRDSFIVVSPQAPSWSYNYNHIKYILPNILSRYRVDTSRIYLTGLSAGGGGVLSVLGSMDSTLIKKFAAASTCSSAGVDAVNGYTSLQVEANLRYATKYWGVQCWSIAGDQDFLLDTDVRYSDSLNAMTPTPWNKLTILSGVGHSSWGKGYDTLFRPRLNYYGNTANCTNGCVAITAPNNNGSPIMGSGVTQDSLNMFEWLLQYQRTFAPQTVSSVSAGSDQAITLPNNSVTVSGSATPALGLGILSLGWTKISGPSNYNIVSPSQPQTIINNLAQGTYVFRYTMTTSILSIAFDEVQIVVNAPVPLADNVGPSVSTGTDQTITLPATSANLTSTPVDFDGSIAQLQWTKLSTPGQGIKRIGVIGSSTAAGSGPSSPSQGFVNLLKNYYKNLGIIDTIYNLAMGGTNVYMGTTSSFVPPGPTLNSADPTINVTAILAKNPDVVLVSYPTNYYEVLTINEIMAAHQNIYNACVAAGKPCYITGTQPRAQFTPAVQAKLLVINDSLRNRFGDHFLDFMTPMVIPGTYTVQTQYDAFDNVHLNAAAHVQLAKIVEAKNIFQDIATSPSTIATPGAANTTINSLGTGTHKFQVGVFDNYYLASHAIVTVTVNATASNTPPIANAGAPISLTLPIIGTVVLDGTGSSDPDGNITNWQWTKIAGPSGGLMLTPTLATSIVTTLGNGTYQYELTVTDNDGATGKDTVTITIGAAPPPNVAPTANAGLNQTITLPTDSTTLNGGGTDSDGVINQYQWTKIAGPTQFLIVSPTTAQTKIDNLAAGVYQFELRVRDDDGAYGRDTVQITVNAAPPPPPPSPCAGRRINITPYPTDSSVYMTPTTNNSTNNIYPGDTLVFSGAYSTVDLNGLTGSPSCPIVLINQGGQVLITKRLNLDGCKYVKVTGSGSSNQYGFFIEQHPVLRRQYFHAIEIKNRAKCIEIERVSMHNVDIGIVAETNGSCADSLNYPNWIMDSIIIHDNSIVGTWNEGMYLGNTSPDNAANSYSPRPVVCNGITVYPMPMRNGYTKVYNNYVDSTGRGGIQLASASHGISEIFNNTIKHAGMNGDDAQGAAITVGAYTHVYIHDNNISNTYTWGISSIGGSGTNIPLRIENNTIDSSGYLNTYHLATTTQTVYNPNTEPIYVNPLSWPQSIEIDTRPTLFTDSTLFWIRGNIIKLKKNNTAINIDNTYNTMHKSGHIICNNINWSNGSPAVLNVVSGISYSTNCAALPNMAPVVNAGLDRTITLPVDSTNLLGSAVDVDGTVSSYQWTKIAGPTQFLIVSPTTAQTKVDNLVAGVYLFELRATDDDGATGRDTVRVTVNPAAQPNVAPTANAGANQTITLPTDSTTLNGGGTDSDGVINQYQWTKIAGPTQFLIVSPTTAQTKIDNLVAGVYQFELRVRDDDGAYGRDTVQITVNAAPPQNVAPTANAGPNQTITLPTDSTTLNGGGTDSDGVINQYQWTKIAGPTQFLIVSPTTAQTKIDNLTAGVYQFELRVRDDDGAFGRDTVQITVNPAPNIPPVANAGPNQILNLPINNTTLNGNGTDTDGSISSYQWTKIFGPTQYTIVSPNTAQTDITNLVAGTYQFVLTVTDNVGATGKDTVTVAVNTAPPANQPPVANAGNDQTITLPINYTTLSGNGVDIDGSIIGYQWAKLSGPTQLTIQSINAAQTDVVNMVAGVYEFELTVTDNQGVTAKDTVRVTVNAANIPPVANAGGNITITLPLNGTPVHGSATDADGTISTHAWSWVFGPTQYNIVAPGSYQTTINNLVAGTYVFRLTVTDNGGATHTDDITIVVNPAPQSMNQAPVAHAGADVTITLPVSNYNAIGTGTDTDGTIASYQWTQIGGPVSAVLATPAQGQTMITGMLVIGKYDFVLTVTDNLGATGRDTLSITVTTGSVVRLYPNPVPPSADHITIDIKAASDAHKMPVEIYSTSGAIIRKEEISRSQRNLILDIDVRNLSKGYYVLKIGVDINNTMSIPFIRK